MADHYQPIELRGCAVEPTSISGATDSVVDNQVTALNMDFHPVTGSYLDAAPRGLRLGGHSEPPIPCATAPGPHYGRGGPIWSVFPFYWGFWNISGSRLRKYDRVSATPT